MNDRITHIFFDVSATLIEPNPSFEQTCIQKLESNNIVVNFDQLEVASKRADYAYRTHKQMTPKLYSNPMTERLVWAHRHSIYMQYIATTNLGSIYPFMEWGYQIHDYYNPSTNWNIYSDVIEVLEELGQNYILCAVSDFGGALPTTLELLGLSKYFEHIVVSSLVGVSKFNPEIYKKALEVTDVNASNVIMVGDNYTADIEISHQIGIRGVWLNRNNHPIPGDVHLDTISGLQELQDVITNMDKLK